MSDTAVKNRAALEMEREVANRIMALRVDSGYTQAEMADMTGFSLEDYTMYEEGGADLPFSFIHKCASVFDVEIMELLEGRTPLLTGYTLTRAGGGQLTSVEPGVLIKNIAPLFKDRIADPYFVVYNYNEEQQHTPIEQVTHPGQEFDYVLEGSMKIRIKDNEEVLHAGDSIFYNSSNPHGIIAVGGQDVRFLALVLPEEGADVVWEKGRLRSREEVDVIKKEASPDALKAPNFVSNFVSVKEREDGYPTEVTFKNTEKFNFAFDVVDAIAEKEPDRLCMVHLDKDKNERRFTFQDMKKMSARAAAMPSCCSFAGTGSSGRSSSVSTNSARSRSRLQTSSSRRIWNTASRQPTSRLSAARQQVPAWKKSSMLLRTARQSSISLRREERERAGIHLMMNTKCTPAATVAQVIPSAATTRC